MKITAIDTFTLRIPTQKPIALDLPEHRLVVTRIQPDADTVGLGYALVFGGAGSESVEAYARRLATLLIGEDPTQVGRLWDKMYRADRGIRKVGVAGYALSALDIGLWDIAGKAAGLPLAKLWGAVTDRVPAYGSGGWGSYSLDDLIGEAKRYVAMGCRYYKMKIHHAEPLENRKRVEAVKKAGGGPPGRGVAARRARAVRARRGGLAERVPRQVHRLDARRSVRRAAALRGRRVPRPRSPRPRHRSLSGRGEEVPAIMSAVRAPALPAQSCSGGDIGGGRRAGGAPVRRPLRI